MKMYKTHKGVLHLQEESVASELRELRGEDAREYSEGFMEGMLDIIMGPGLRSSLEKDLKKKGIKPSRYYAMLMADDSKYIARNCVPDLGIADDSQADGIRFVSEWFRLMDPTFGCVVMSLPNPRRVLYVPEHSVLVMQDRSPGKGGLIIVDKDCNEVEIERKIAS